MKIFLKDLISKISNSQILEKIEDKVISSIPEDMIKEDKEKKVEEEIPPDAGNTQGATEVDV